MPNNDDLLASRADSAFHAENARIFGEHTRLMNSMDPGVFDRINQKLAGSHVTPPAPPTLSASVAPAPAPAASALASRPYAELTNWQRQQLANEDPEAFARNRAAWERDGHPGPGQSMPVLALGYEHWTNHQRALVAARDPDRFTAARNDWLARGEPEPPEAA